MTMTAARLYEIVKDVPDVWSSLDLDYGMNNFLVWGDDGSVVVDVPTAEAAFVGAMVRHGLDRGIRPGHIPGVARYWTYNAKGEAGPAFPTLIEALAAACKELPKENSNG